MMNGIGAEANAMQQAQLQQQIGSAPQSASTDNAQIGAESLEGEMNDVQQAPQAPPNDADMGGMVDTFA